MSSSEWLQVVLYLAVLLGLVKPLGGYMAQVYGGRWEIGPERWIYRLAGIAQPAVPMTWVAYAGAFLASNMVGLVLVYALLRVQHSANRNDRISCSASARAV